MNWKLILSLSMFGLVMALGTVFVIPSKVEPLFWLAIFLVCAFLIARRAPGKFFFHGFCVSLVNCVWITGAHVILFDAYAARHVEEMQMSAKFPFPQRVAMLVVGPVVGVISGIVLGIFSLIASKLVKKTGQ